MSAEPIYDLVLEAVIERLQGSPSIVDNDGEIRRRHRTPRTPETCPAVFVVDGIDRRTKDANCDHEREGGFIVQLHLRGDDTLDDEKALKAVVMERLDPEGGLGPDYPDGVTIVPEGINMQSEVADLDVTVINMHFSIQYRADRWSLGRAA